jgi:hypothetical protein|tara:strand:- start:4534 stop:4758 length:225 start_codon:yes stop_codon:yes gene_type:complete
MSDWLIGRQEIADYAVCSTWTVTAMLKAGLKASGGKVKGSPPRTKKEYVDQFFIDNPDFNASKFHKPKPRIRSL